MEITSMVATTDYLRGPKPEAVTDAAWASAGRLWSSVSDGAPPGFPSPAITHYSGPLFMTWSLKLWLLEVEFDQEGRAAWFFHDRITDRSEGLEDFVDDVSSEVALKLRAATA